MCIAECTDAAVAKCPLTGQRVAAHYRLIVNAFAAPESRGELCFHAIARRAAAIIAAGVVAISVSLVLSPASAGAADSPALLPWTEPVMPPPPVLPRFGGPPGMLFAVADETADVVLLHFFASWCEPCREELPALRRLAERGGPGVKVIAVAVADNEAALRRVADAAGINFPILMDSDRAVARAWSISALPSTVALDSRHRPRLIVETDFAWDTIEPRALIERLASPAASSSLANNVQQTTATKGGQ